jgi:hypothetical protein
MSRASLALATMALLAATASGSGSRSGANEDGPPPGRAAPAKPAAPDIDLWQIRNIFRYADRAAVGSHQGATPARPPIEETAEETEDEPRVRLVGLMKKGGRPVVALAIDGEVVVLGEGESSGGVTVIAVADEAVSLRGPEEKQETLLIP